MENNLAIKAVNLCKSYENRPSITKLIRAGVGRSLGFSNHGGDSKQQKASGDGFALSNLDFQVKKGEALGIIGRNGSGKSTLLQMLAGTLTPSSGKIKIQGRVGALLELGSGFNFDFTGRENVFLNGAINGLARREVIEKFDAIADFAEIGHFIEKPVRTYSTGMMLRLAFAIQTVLEPEVLIIDEALAVGDEAFQRKCIAHILKMKAQGVTILFVSHAPNQVIELCDRVLLLNQGNLLLDSAPNLGLKYYHKLIYAETDNEQKIIDEIKAKNPKATKNGDSEEATDEGCSKNKKSNPEESIEPYWDVNFQSKSKVNYQTRGAEIHGVKILSDQNEKVNHLVWGRHYTYSYSVTFQQRPKESVRFGMMIKSLNGVELGGGVSKEHSLSKGFDKEQIVEVRFGFKCQLVSGSYFCNAGVEGIRNGERTYLHRIEDAMIFRVMERNESDVTGWVGFVENCEIVENPAPGAMVE